MTCGQSRSIFQGLASGTRQAHNLHFRDCQAGFEFDSLGYKNRDAARLDIPTYNLQAAYGHMTMQPPRNDDALTPRQKKKKHICFLNIYGYWDCTRHMQMSALRLTASASTVIATRKGPKWPRSMPSVAVVLLGQAD